MKKVLIMQNRIAEYRVPIFNKLCDYYDITVAYSSGSVPKNSTFKTFQAVNHQGKLFWTYDKTTRAEFKKYDVIIVPMDNRQLDIQTFIFLKKHKIIAWGIGVPASYKVPYDSLKKNTFGFDNYIKNATACLFYCDYPVDKYHKMGVCKDRLFVAPNTVEVLPLPRDREKDKIIFIGSLYKQKRIFELLNAYLAAYKASPFIPTLEIIGDGSERAEVEKFIQTNELQNQIILAGEIFDEQIIAEKFHRAIACFSPNQAGLSVLKSMGYGVPFITHKNAITGGERFNITHKETGILFDDFSELKDIILDITTNKEAYLQYGKNAYDYYWTERTPQKMVDGFREAIEYVLGE